jgi:hypothetical protein
MNDPDTVISDFERHRQVRAKVNESNKGAVFDALAGAHVTEVRVAFDGEGDAAKSKALPYSATRSVSICRRRQSVSRA